MSDECILITGACQNHLKNLDLRLPLHELIVVTGVSGSGKSSLAFDTVYAEGQRRYVETFSPYARQFLERMDKPRVERIQGIPPAIAIDQTNPVRTSRSTVGTMTELNDHLKLLYARAAQLYCRGCGAPVRRDTPVSIATELLSRQDQVSRVLVTFPVAIPERYTEEELRGLLAAQGYARIHARRDDALEVVQDRLALGPERRDRLMEALETALSRGHGQLAVHALDAQRRTRATWRYSAALHCPTCDLHYREPVPNLFSFNSPLGACPTCRGFGRTLGIDYGLVIPDARRSLAQGAIKPWQSASYLECQGDLMRFARARGVPTDVPWRTLSGEQQRWVIEGEGSWDEGVWYGIRRFFDWLESKSYKMHIRVLLSKYRSYDACPQCRGARLTEEALLWRLVPEPDHGPAATASATLDLHQLTSLSIAECRDFFSALRLAAPLDQATELLLGEIRTRLDYLVEVGLGYLTLDRQSRTLSGGEVQRINLTTALGTSLVNTLFVLDEPSIGLHARDIGRLVSILHRLRDAGNSLLVVEHDPQIMRAADRILDLGPGPGTRGGEVVFFGTPPQLRRARGSLTAQYLTGRKRRVSSCTPSAGAPDAGHAVLQVLGAAEHNLANIDVSIPLQRLVCVTGVSGSGKSTLVQDILFPALAKLTGRQADAPGRHRGLLGHESLVEVVMVDQSPIGRTARSNPASHVGALDPIRKLFAAEPAARRRGYTPATFSFNSGTGRCPVCSGSGFEHVEMQFLSDVYLRCPECDGRRYRAEVLEVKLAGCDPRAPARSMAEVLELTVSDALAFFADREDVVRTLEPLQAVGLGYLSLGQPVPTLSGGEAQRLKLAGHLARPRARRENGGAALFLFDEPTTGLHFEDVATLLAAFRKLLREGHSVVVIEHNLDVIAAADWIIDLGPEGGPGGGHVVCSGMPAEIAACAGSHTGAALREHWTTGNVLDLRARPPAAARARNANGGDIRIHHAREHNLRNIDVSIPRDRFTVITGVSGSGKSTVAFDILFAEGQRRYLESLNAYARQFVQPAARPDVDAIFGIPPTVAIEQRTSRGGRKSTVATMTEVYHFLRLLFVKLGTQYCPDCDLPIEPQQPESILAQLLREWRGRRIVLLAPLVVARKGYYTDLAQWAAARGFAELRVDGELLRTAQWPRLDRFKEHDIELPVGEIAVAPEREAELRALLARTLAFGDGMVQVIPAGGARAGRSATRDGRRARIFSVRRACPGCGRSFEAPDPRLFSYNSRHGWCPSCFGTGEELPGFDAGQSGEERHWNEPATEPGQPCPACAGRRLRPQALAVRFEGLSIAEITELSVSGAEQRLRALKLSGRAAQIARDPLAELRTRLGFLRRVGLGYLSLDRAAPTLSGGEVQRIRLAAQLGSNLQGVCYILDEPTIGLHPRDNRMLLATLDRLGRKGNTVVVVEHDEQTIRRAGHVIDLGPGAGTRGGRVVATGTPAAIMASPESVTGRYLAHPVRHAPAGGRRDTGCEVDPPQALEIQGAALHNLKDIDVRIPLQRLVCVTGVSGSGKSSLVRECLQNNLRERLARGARASPRGCRALRGTETLSRVLEVDQTPIGKTPRSCPATYVGFWDYVRRLYAETSEARLRGYTPGRFSFNVKGGRCEACEGQGRKRIEMSFLPDVDVPCEVCAGARFNAETLIVHFKDRNVANLLDMSVDEAVEFFAAHPAVHHPLQLLQDVGLGYLSLGQPSPTLSGGEAQRIKLITELAKVRPALPAPPRRGKAAAPGGHACYILDEPTIGLHMADVEKLVRVLKRLVAAGHTVVVIEHNLDVIAQADWILDLGPEGGDDGGQLVAEGTPQAVARVRRGSQTARFLRSFLRERRRVPG